jgi:hypothetical protein
METKTLGILGAISSLVVLPGMAVGAPAAFQPAVAPAHSFAELLDPIPNAVERLKIADAQDAAKPRLIKAQYNDHHHHHHHHNAYVVVPQYHPYYRPHYRRHVYRYGYRYGYSPRVIVPYIAPYQDHHHHHHHHHHQQDGY